MIVPKMCSLDYLILCTVGVVGVVVLIIKNADYWLVVVVYYQKYVVLII